jgi:hypothetical protein
MRLRAWSVALGSVAALAVSACDRRTRIEQPICDVNETGINDSTIGPLAIGEAVPALRERCPAIKDTTIALQMLGWTDSVRAVRLMVRGAPVFATYDSLRTTAGAAGMTVTALRVESPFFRTNDSLGVGTSIAPFRGLRGVRITHVHDSPRVALMDRRRCGVTYELSSWGGIEPATVPANDTLPEVVLSGAQIADWPESIVVTAVNVAGCHGNVRDLGVDSIAEAGADRVAAPMPDSFMVRQTPSIPVMPAPKSPPPTASARDAVLPAVLPAELAQLAANLDVPVRGVTRAQLRDTYAEARSGHTHEALDILAPRGTEVLSATDGTLRKLFNSKTGGLMVYAADPTDRFVLLYGHLDRYAAGLKDGMPLKRGQVIGYVGTTGNAPANTPHLHFGILRGQPSKSWARGTAVNPYPLLHR